MSFHTVVRSVIAAVVVAAPVVASAGPCVEISGRRSGADLCRSGGPAVVAVVLPGDQWNEHFPVNVEFPQRMITVLFYRPVKVGNRVLFGKYFIEHDNVRMSRGQPCTHIYAASDPRLPVVTFRCRHLISPATTRPTVVVRSLGEANGMTELLSFQFAGETGAHGVPVDR